MKILKEKTKSICPQCFQELDARVVEENNKVFLEKECSNHGKFVALIEEDAGFYTRIMNKEFRNERIPFQKLALPITQQCNLNCQICYAPYRENNGFPMQDLKIAIQDFKGKLIKLTGGEPTLDNNLPFLIRTICKDEKKCTLVSNGINLANASYVRILKEAGLKRVAISLHGGFSDNIYKNISGQKLLKDKLKALTNLKKAGIEVILSVTLVRGINENELAKVYHYYLNNRYFVKTLRIRSLCYIGRYIDNKPFCMSEIIKLLSKVTRFKKDELIESYFKYKRYHPEHCYASTCRFRIDLFNTFIYRIEKKGFQKKRFKKLRFILESLFLFGVRTTIEMIINKIKGKNILLDAEIEIRVWPDKEKIDLGEIQYCPTAILTLDRKLFPFCYAIILDEQNCFI